MPTISKAITTDWCSVKNFYKEVGYSGDIQETDTIILAHEKSKIVGAVRLCQEEKKLVLRGMYVNPHKQRTGIGHTLLEAVSNEIGPRECWCIPYTHLCGLYGTIGFKKIPLITVPSFLATRLGSYIENGKSVVFLERPENWRVFPNN